MRVKTFVGAALAVGAASVGQATSQKVPLTTTGLGGDPFGRLPTEYACGPSRRVLLRIRGDFVKPTAFRAAPPFGYPMLLAGGATTQTQLAIVTHKGKPIAYASISRSKTPVYTSQACRED